MVSNKLYIFLVLVIFLLAEIQVSILWNYYSQDETSNRVGDNSSKVSIADEDRSGGFYIPVISAQNSSEADTPITSIEPSLSLSEISSIAADRTWLLTRETLISMGKGGNSTPSKDVTEFLLLLRKLALLSVKELNKRIESQDCSPWWVNPLSVNELSEKIVSKQVTQYKLIFEAQPGRIPFETTLLLFHRIKNETNPYTSNEVVFVSGRRLDTVKHTSLQQTCGSIPRQFWSICLCPEEKMSAELDTLKLRETWSKDDPELVYWPPNVTMFVPDYITFGNKSLYLLSPTRNTEFCGPTIDMILFVSSAPAHLEERNAIRVTFGHFTFLEKQKVRLLFGFGRISDEVVQANIDEEFAMHDDIVQANYVHNYHNLTLRLLSMYNWVVTHCRYKASQMPRWILKTDDDYFVNIPLAFQITQANPDLPLIGDLTCPNYAVRNITSKWYTPRYMQPPDQYHGFLLGTTYLIRTDILEPILKVSLSNPVSHMDDVYVLGLYALEIGVTPRDSWLIVLHNENPNACSIKQKMNTWVEHSPKLMKQIWKLFRKPVSSECKLNDLLLKVKPLTQKRKQKCLFE